MSWSLFVKLVMLEQTLFGLPWALIGALGAVIYNGSLMQGSWDRWVWMILAFSSARSAGMSLNRLIDRHFDALNLRTVARPLPSGLVSVSQVKNVIAITSILFLISCSFLGRHCFLLSILIWALMLLYSFTKRWTALCHFVLGAIEFLIPIMGWLAIAGVVQTPAWYMASAVFFWISGMDIVYCLQDLSFDRQYRLHSIGVSLGPPLSLLIARGLHLLTFAFLIASGIALGVGMLYYFWMIPIAFLLIYQHLLVRSNRPYAMKKAFFICNSWISICAFAAFLSVYLCQR